ncbi:hypothetical protein [Tsukamurella sp. 1534]|uniref:hypothetical protein n=1 Tax=Tsukamurella sp. 1534 TaxID=1151061 RepID=UPI0002F56D1F|nr:hypothetical protein [Tsukamurella sp. 1534]
MAQPQGPVPQYGGAPTGGFPAQGYPQHYPPGPLPGQPGPATPAGPGRPFPTARVGAGVTVVAGLAVLFCSLFDLYTVTVDPGPLPDDEVTGTVEVGMGFYGALLPAPMIAMAAPLLLLVASLTAVPGILGRHGQGSLASAVSAIGGTLLALVLIVADPLPSVRLDGQLSTDFQAEMGDGITTVDQLIDRLVDVSPGIGLILALTFGVIASAGAVLNFLQLGENRTVPDGARALPVPATPFPGGYGAVPAVGPVPGVPVPAVVPPEHHQAWQRPVEQYPPAPGAAQQHPAGPPSGQFPASPPSSGYVIGAPGDGEQTGPR